jgi:hypothetical protein
MNSVFAILPQFVVSKIQRTDSVVHYSGVVKNLATFSKAKPGWIVVICIDENRFVEGKFTDVNLPNYQVTIDVSDLASQDYLRVGEEYPLLDGYWGELVELVFNNSIIWKRVKFESKDSTVYHPDGRVEILKGGWNHEHCKICFQNISMFEADDQFGYVNQKDDWLCESCYQKYAANKSLDFVKLDQIF